MDKRSLEADAIQFFIENGVLTFGDFTLKSGRKSPYFFNTGSLCTSRQLKKLGELYAEKIEQEAIFNNAQVIFGSAYKGIPIAVATAVALAERQPAIRAVSDRKEAKTHGDAGEFLGLIQKGDKVVIVDDVITTGGTKLEAIEKLRKIGCEPLGFVIAFDRAEPAGENSKTAKESFEAETGLPVFALATIHDIVRTNPEMRVTMNSYLKTIGAYNSESEIGSQASP